LLIFVAWERFMNKTIFFLSLGLSFFCAGSAGALDAQEKSYIERLAKGGPDTLRNVAESLYQSGNTNPAVLDVAAEVLLQKYQRSTLDRNSADAMAWLCRTLGASGNNRYKAAIDEVVDKADHRKLRGRCKKASKILEDGATSSYTRGMVDLQKVLEPPAAPAGKSKTK
jgi:hypothetical protein